MRSDDQAREDYANGYYAKKLAQGLEFQDSVVDWLWNEGLVIASYSSKAYQHHKGENRLGCEIKRDGKFRETGNLYIETEEKSHPDRPYYVPSGIHRDDNSWLFAIGDERTLWIFSHTMLRGLAGRFRQVTKPTSKGYLLPISVADKYCDRKLERDAEADR